MWKPKPTIFEREGDERCHKLWVQDWDFYVLCYAQYLGYKKELEVEGLHEILLPLLAGVIPAKLRGEVYIEYHSVESNHSLFVSIDFSPSRYNFIDGFPSITAQQYVMQL